MKCPTCKKKHNRIGNGYCHTCHAAYMRQHRPTYSQLTDEQKKRSNCRSYARVYRKRGKLIQLPCQNCGDKKSEMHHEDYDKPLEVTWMCRQCHLLHHNMLLLKKVAQKHLNKIK